VTLFESLVGVEAWLPPPAIPHNHCAAAILALGDVPLEVEILHRVVFGANGKALFTHDQARPLGDGPAFQRAAVFEPQIIMHTPRIVLLDNELPAFTLAAFGLGFGGPAKIALLRVFLERVPAR
jgi:hypothetical protein